MTAPADAEVAARLRGILESPEYRKHVSDYVTEELLRLLKEAFHWLRGLRPEARWTLFTVCLALLGAMVVQIALSLRPARRSSQLARAASRREAEVSADEIESLASDLARAGRLREAARTLHQAALLKLSRARGLPWRSELSDWEWVQALREVPGLPEFTRTAQRLAYGPDPDGAGFAACQALYRGLETA